MGWQLTNQASLTKTAVMTVSRFAAMSVMPLWTTMVAAIVKILTIWTTNLVNIEMGRRVKDEFGLSSSSNVVDTSQPIQ